MGVSVHEPTQRKVGPMESFGLFALCLMRGLTSPIVVVNDRLEVVTANESGWNLLGGKGMELRGRSLDDLVHPTTRRVRTPAAAPQPQDPINGWPSILHSSVRHFPRMELKPASGEGAERVLNLEVSPLTGDDLQSLAAILLESHPEWLEDGGRPDLIDSLITPNNHILYFQDVTDLALYEARRQECMRNTLDMVVRTLDHYIRNALTPILGYSDLMRRKGNSLPPEQIGQIMEKVTRNVNLITSLLDALRTVRDIHIEEPLGADATLVGIEKDLKARLAEVENGSRTG